jgi:hypothetical protein
MVDCSNFKKKGRMLKIKYNKDKKNCGFCAWTFFLISLESIASSGLAIHVMV